MKMVPAAHEAGTVLMALAYTQVTGKIGVATVTQGPGLANCFTALREGVVGLSDVSTIGTDLKL